MLSVGDSLPKFQLPNEEGKIHSNGDIKGKYAVFFFYPKDNTPGCTKEACDFTAKISDFKKMGVEVFGVSKDSVASHQKFVEKQNLKITLLSDEKGDFLTACGVLVEKSMFGKKYMGIVRSTFIISPEGKIVYVNPKVSVLGHVKEVLGAVKKLTA